MLIYLLVNSVLEVVPNGNIALEALLVALEGVTLNRTYKTLIKKSHERQKLPETQKENCLDKSPLILTRSPIRITANTINGSAVAAANRERILLLRCGDIEQNPGPEPRGEQQRKKFSSTVVTSYNVRGINDEKKLRHLINKVYKDMKRNSTESIICFQETFVEKEGKLSYLWRGNLHLTPGTGSSCGCLTLTSSNLNILEAADLDGRAHIISCQRTNEQDTAYVIANIYAPNPNNLEKIDFFDRVLDKVQDFKERFNCSNVIIAGDFNLNFDWKEAKNRQYTAQERRVADFVKENTEALQLKDCWENRNKFTWRRPNTEIFSTIDRILYSSQTLALNSVDTNWSYRFSDHAAVVADFSIKDKYIGPRTRLTRLDPSLVKSSKYRPKIEQGFRDMMETAPHDWNPHLKLEFAKVCIRTVVEQAQAERKRQEKTEEEELNDEIELSVNKLASGDGIDTHNLIDYVEELRVRKQVIIEERGTRLAEKLGTKWYNEGEKSTRYFMSLLNRSLPDRFELIQGEDNVVISDPARIEEAIVKFYKTLYEEHGLAANDDQDFFNHIESISGEDNDFIAREMTTGELLETLQTCADSSPGPDGIPYSILRLLWPIYGDLLSKAWKYSLEKRSLPPSHKTSFLRLIPKAGKDLKKLTNWRPITLSNCDHKLITKTYAKRLCEKVSSKISGCQTAYL